MCVKGEVGPLYMNAPFTTITHSRLFAGKKKAIHVKFMLCFQQIDALLSARIEQVQHLNVY